jgi:hypothetical protein
MILNLIKYFAFASIYLSLKKEKQMTTKVDFTKEHSTLFTLYLCKLIEYGLIPNNGVVLSPQGFDNAMNIYDNGIRLTNAQVTFFVNNTPKLPKKLIHTIGNSILHLQHLGFDKFKKQLDEIKVENGFS